MSNLKPLEKRAFEDLFGMASGYVLDFTNASFAQFFQDSANTDIYHNRYASHGDSKAKRLRAFWETEPDELVGTALNELLDVWEYENPDDSGNVLRKMCQIAIDRLLGKKSSSSQEEFLDRKIEFPDLSKLGLESAVTKILASRLGEIEKSLKSGASLSVIFLCGSILEGALLGAAIRDPKKFNQSKCSPKDKSSKVKGLQDWTLSQFIDVACDIGIIELDVKKFSHVLRDFRNYIHPYEQVASKFNPNDQTAEICFQVLKAALADLSQVR